MKVQGSDDGIHTDSDMEYASKQIFTNQAENSISNEEEERLHRKSNLHKSSLQDVSPDLSSQETCSRHQLSSFATQLVPSALPFEFLALEACLEAACSSLDAEVSVIITTAFVIHFRIYLFHNFNVSLKYFLGLVSIFTNRFLIL